MKKRRLCFYGGLLIGLTSCHTPVDSLYATEEPVLTLSLPTPSLTILQVTDLHLTFGIDYNDRHTFQLINDLASEVTPDLIVITGDLTMAPYSQFLVGLLVQEMDSLDIPWTFVFGNHESDFAPNTDIIGTIQGAKNLLFSPGIALEEGGIGNFVISANVDENPWMNLYFLDSKAERGGILSYDYFSEAQVGWVDSHLEKDQLQEISSLMFMHIPLVQYKEFDQHDLVDGALGEDQVYSQGEDTGLFNTLTTYGLTKGVFAGHDHLNNFSFFMDDILLAYGQVTGYNAYGSIERGGRVIEIDDQGNLSSYLLLESELNQDE